MLQLTSMKTEKSLMPHPPLVLRAEVPMERSNDKSVWVKITSMSTATSSPGEPPKSHSAAPALTSEDVVIPEVAEV
jgi:hypothetical protein